MPFRLVRHCTAGRAATLSSAPLDDFATKTLIVHKKMHVLADHVKFDNMLHRSILSIVRAACPRSGLCEAGDCCKSNYLSAMRGRIGMVPKHA
jgi:hypothetical protein